MKIAVLADIHANRPALEAVLTRAESLGVERIFVLGDFVGYYYWPAECLELLSAWHTDRVIGNHEDLLASARLDSEARASVRKTYGSGISLALDELSSGDIEMLTHLPRTSRLRIEGRTVLLCHGSPSATDEYVYPDAPSERREAMVKDGADAVFFGHTHYPIIWQVAGALVVNPGSVGQPRNREPGAHWALWDTAENSVEQHREDYPVEPVLRECAARDPGLPYLSRVLVRTG